MLIELHIEDLGVIEHVQIVLGPGLTALTGETGTGKTMLVEAIDLLVGGRADTSMVRVGAEEARIDGRFVVPHTGDQAHPDDPDDADDADEIVLTRIVPADGRSRAYVNGRLSTVATLAEVARALVDLHGQHTHQSLLAGPTQRAALDSFGSIDLDPLRRARATITEIDAELATLGGDERTRAREIDLLRFQVDELDRAGVHDPLEDDTLAAEEELLADALAHRAAGAEAVDALTHDDGARDLLGRSLSALADRAPYAELHTRLHGLLAEVDDVVGELRSVSESIDEDPDRLEEVRARRKLLADLCRKYGDDLTEVMEYHRTTEDRLRDLEGFEERAAALARRRAAALDAERDEARIVGERRREAAPRLAALVESRLWELAMPHASVSIEVGDGADDHPGDRVQFLLAANPGSPLLPLTRVASGGELARAMLALRLVLTADSTRSDPSIGTLVFDEVDAGIGGAAAAAVGDALRALSDRHQVLVVTHLPQVAARAHRQIVVDKRVVEGSTTAEITMVDGDDRVAELARMLSGGDSAVALDHARDLLDRP